MKDFKYFVIFGISLIAFIYVVAFMPSIKLLEDHSDELWFSDAENSTEFYIDGVQGIEAVKEKYTGKVSSADLKTRLDISIGKLQDIYSVYDNDEETYNINKASFYADFGITNYIEYDMICNSMKKIFDSASKDKVLSAKVIENSVIENTNGIIFNVEVRYTSQNLQTLIVVFYNEEQKPLENDSTIKLLPTILKILPKVEG